RDGDDRQGSELRAVSPHGRTRTRAPGVRDVTAAREPGHRREYDVAVNVKSVLSKVGTVVFIIGVVGIGALIAWNVFGQGPYGDTCKFSLGCKTFYCVHHELRGDKQWTSPKGMCTKECEKDDDCGSGARCVVLSDDTRDDLPPFGKPERACLRLA